MTAPDFRALCAEAAEHLSLLDDPPHQLVIAMQEALAQPAPEPTFTDEEVAMHSAPWSYLNPAPEPPASEESLPPRVGFVFRLAEIIQEVDGSNELGATALAEAILSHPSILARWGQGND